MQNLHFFQIQKYYAWIKFSSFLSSSENLAQYHCMLDITFTESQLIITYIDFLQKWQIIKHKKSTQNKCLRPGFFLEGLISYNCKIVGIIYFCTVLTWNQIWCSNFGGITPVRYMYSNIVKDTSNRNKIDPISLRSYRINIK